MSILSEFADGEPLLIVTSTLGDKIATAAERIASLAHLARHTEERDESELNPLLEIICDLASDILAHEKHASEAASILWAANREAKAKAAKKAVRT